MTTAVDITHEPRHPLTSPSPGSGDVGARLAGAGALVFVGTVLLQNVVRGASAPANGASPQEVLTHYAHHSTTTSVLVAMFVLSGIGLAVFLGGVMRRLVDGDRRGWALSGYVGGIGIMVLFSVLVAMESALTVVAHADHPAAGAVEAVWALHNSVFTVLLFAISVALTGLSRAGVAAGITPRAFRFWGPLGSALLIVGVLSGPAIAAGNAPALFGVAAIGFLVWLAFLVATGLRLIRVPTP